MTARGQSEETDDVTSGSDDDDSDVPWNQAKQPAGLVASVCNELFRKQPKEDGAGHDLEALKREKCKQLGITLPGDQVYDQGTTCDVNSGKDQTAICDNNEVNKQIGNMTLENSDQNITEIASCEAQNKNSMGDNREMQIEDGGPSDRKQTTPPAPPINGDCSVMLQEILSLDLNMEFVTRYQAKPRSMYTFLCSQNFRRDEYAGHFRHVHSELLSGLNGWIEARCPLAQEGCTYSYRFVEIRKMEVSNRYIYIYCNES